MDLASPDRSIWIFSLKLYNDPPIPVWLPPPGTKYICKSSILLSFSDRTEIFRGGNSSLVVILVLITRLLTAEFAIFYLMPTWLQIYVTVVWDLMIIIREVGPILLHSQSGVIHRAGKPHRVWASNIRHHNQICRYSRSVFMNVILSAWAFLL